MSSCAPSNTYIAETNNRLQDRIGTLEGQKRDVEKEQAEIEKNNLIEELKKGKDFEPNAGRYGSYNVFEYGYKKSVYGVKSIKILKVSGSGKTANVEVTVQDYNNNDSTRTLNKVQMSKIINFNNHYQS